MPIKKPLLVVFYKDYNKQHEPVHRWLKTFDKNELKKIGHSIMVLQFRWPLGMPLVKNLNDGLWELRITLSRKIVRIFFITNDNYLILLHGFIKKTQKIPHQELEIALKRKKIFESYQKEQK